MRRVVVTFLVLLLCIGGTVGAASFDDKGTLHQTKVFLTKDGSIALAKEDFESLSDKDQKIVRDLLTRLNLDNMFSVNEAGILKITNINELPRELRPVAAAWNGTKITRTQTKGSSDESGTVGALDDSYLRTWYEFYFIDKVNTITDKHHVIVSHRRYPCLKDANYELEVEVGYKYDLTGTVSLSGGLSREELAAVVSFVLDKIYYWEASRRITYSVKLGEYADIRCIWTEYKETCKFDKWYMEDYENDGTVDYIYYCGSVVGVAIDKRNANYDIGRDPIICPENCSGCDCLGPCDECNCGGL